MKTLPEAIKELRALGKTQVEIAELTGLSQGYISDVEKGKKGNRTPADTLLRVLAIHKRLTAHH